MANEVQLDSDGMNDFEGF